MAWYSLLDTGDIATTNPQPLSGAAAAPGASGQLADRDHVHAFAPTTTLDMGGQRLANLGAPTGANDAARKADVDAVSAGLTWKKSVRAASTGNLTLSGEQTVDGVALSAGDRVLAKNQTAGAENGVYVVAAGAWSRASDADTADELESAAVFVEEGTTNADSAWVMTTDNPTLGTTALTWTQFSGLGQVTAGAGLTKTGNQLDVQVDGGTLEINADALRVKAGGLTNSHIAAGAAIELSKLAVDPLARANHTGTQTASTISDFDTQVRSNRLDQMTPPAASVSMNLQQLTSLVLEQFTTAGRPAAAANKRLIFNTTVGRVQIDR